MIQQILILLTVWLAANLTLADEASTRPVKWGEGTRLSQEERQLYQTRAYDLLRKLSIPASEFSEINGTFWEREKYQQPNDTVRLGIWATNLAIEIEFFYPPQDVTHYFHDWRVDHRALDTGKPVHSTRERALRRAQEIARVLDNIDLGDESRWKLTCQGFVGRYWLVSAYALIDGYIGMAHQVTVGLADDKELSLVKYQNTIYELPKVNTDVKISEGEARKLADKYLNKYYHKHELKTLEFSTNVLEILVPNYAFTPQDTGYEGWANPTNPPVLVWKAIYARKNNTLEQTPVQIWVDATDGTMRGGWE